MSTGATVLERQRVRPARTGPVVVAVDDDENAAAVLRSGAALATGMGVALRAVYIWSDCRPPDCPHHRRCHRDLGEASRLLSELLAGQPADGGLEVERNVLHDGDPAAALVSVSSAASCLVLGASSDHLRRGDGFGRTTRSVLERAACPVIVVPCQPFASDPPAGRTARADVSTDRAGSADSRPNLRL